MAVLVKPLNILSTGAAGTPPATLFTDAGGSRPSGGALGQNWFEGISYYTPFSNPTGNSVISIGNAIVDGQPAIIAGPGGTANPFTVFDAVAVPIPIWSGVWGKSQFVQFTFIEYANVTSNTIFGGFLFYQTSALLNGYGMRANLHAANGIVVSRYAPNGTNAPGSNINGTTLITNAGLGGISTFANGDVIRLSADTSVAGQITVTLKVNGVVKGSGIDHSPLVGGLPAYVAEVGNGQVSIRNFSAGLGL